MGKEFIKLGFYLGVGGTITHSNNKKTRKMLKNIGISNIVLETDSPYLAPEGKRGEENNPMNLIYIIGKISEELDIMEEEIIKITTENAQRIFKL
jgi:TatD DNase family protein